MSLEDTVEAINRELVPVLRACRAALNRMPHPVATASLEAAATVTATEAIAEGALPGSYRIIGTIVQAGAGDQNAPVELQVAFGSTTLILSSQDTLSDAKAWGGTGVFALTDQGDIMVSLVNADTGCSLTALLLLEAL